MNSNALAMMIITLTVVTGFTVYFFYKMLTTPPKPEPDSYSEEPGNVTKTPFGDE